MANHASTRTTQLYDRQRDEVSLDEIERIVDLEQHEQARTSSRKEGAQALTCFGRTEGNSDKR
jgi:hypothetical protein